MTEVETDELAVLKRGSYPQIIVGEDKWKGFWYLFFGLMFFVLSVSVPGCPRFAAAAMRTQGCRSKTVASGKEMTKRFEGFRAKIYVCPAGARSIGYGFNIDDPRVRALIAADVLSGRRAMSRAEADRVFDILYAATVDEARAFVGPALFDGLPPGRRAILTDMTYNLGAPKIRGFKKMRAAIMAGDHRMAAAEMKNSKWYKQTGRRARHHVKFFHSGG